MPLRFIFKSISNNSSESSKKCKPGSRSLFSSLPLDGVVFLSLAGTGIILTVLLASNQAELSHVSMSHVSLVTLYLGFSLYGVVDILLYFSARMQNCAQLRRLCLGVALMVDGVLYLGCVQTGGTAAVLTMLSIASAVLSLLIQADPLLVISLMVQGT